ncbi:MAG: ubiquinol-cytochrome c reductase iron-sulfur subunit [Gammaproteobacteria bacterium]|nr:ubiquinol-cytochrome c reductase iron-sulfur subunit [Gammaproteobacteria bacterium]
MADQSFSTDEIDEKKRRTLIAAATVVGGAGVVMLARPLVESMLPSERAQAAGAPVEVELKALQPGQLMTVEWRGKPVWIVHRTPEMLANLAKNAPNLRDPESTANSQQPPFAQNEYRSQRPEFLIVVGICTHLGCAPTFRPEVAAPDIGADWNGGFFCPCHGSRYDLAGRVYAGVPAPLNLQVPPYKFVNDTRVVIGLNTETA